MASSPYDKIVDMIKKLDMQDDGIVMNHKIKSIEQDFCTIVLDKYMLRESMEYINNEVLTDHQASLNFALLFASRNFDSLALEDIKVRNTMINILEMNFRNADKLKKEDINLVYNSITILGEYFHRIRLAGSNPVAVLGEGLLDALIKELCLVSEEPPQMIDTKFAKLILSQVTLNGSLLRRVNEIKLNYLLCRIRQSLIELPNLGSNTKAFLLMTLDLYYSHFADLGHILEDMYTKYLIDDEQSRNPGTIATTTTATSTSTAPSSPATKTSTEEETLNNDLDKTITENGGECGPEVCDMNFKWSDEVLSTLHDSHLSENSLDNTLTQKSDEISNSSSPHQKHMVSSPSATTASSTATQNNNGCIYDSQNSSGGGYDDDRQSVRSEGGSIRLYSVSDRLKNPQRRNYNQNNDWERNYNSLDRPRSHSRNSNHSQHHQQNNDHHNGGGGGGGGHNDGGNRMFNGFRGRFRRFSNSNNEYWRNPKNNPTNTTGGGSNNNSNNNTNNNFYSQNRQNHQNVQNHYQNQQSNSRSSSRNRNNIPRPDNFRNRFDRPIGRSQSPDNMKKPFNNDHNNQMGNNNRHNNASHNNHHHHQQQQQQQQPQQQYHQKSRNFSHNRGNRYGSQSSLNSEQGVGGHGGSGTWERRGRRRNMRGKSQEFYQDDTRSLQDPAENWDTPPDNNEIIKNARNTTDYLKYLSEK